MVTFVSITLSPAMATPGSLMPSWGPWSLHPYQDPQPCQYHPGVPNLPDLWPHWTPHAGTGIPNPVSPWVSGVPPSLPAPSQGLQLCHVAMAKWGVPRALPVPWMQMGPLPCPLYLLCPRLTPVLGGLEDVVRQDDGRLQIWEFLPPQRLIPWQAGTRKAALVQSHH